MKKIIFIRHGRAEDQAPEFSDFERSLTTKGKAIAHQMAKKFREKEPDPGLLITSPAFRALETAYIFASEAGIDHGDVRVLPALYSKPGIKMLLDLTGTLDEDLDTITLFGHNPSFTEMPDKLSRDGCEFVTKTSVVCISFQVRTWSEIKAGTGKLEYFMKPEKNT
jgi:phosphohistidine phosphatase